MRGGAGGGAGSRKSLSLLTHPGVEGDGVYTVRTVKLYGPVRKVKTVVDYLVFIFLCKHIMVVSGQQAPNNPPQTENGLDAVSLQTNKDTKVH